MQAELGNTLYVAADATGTRDSGAREEAPKPKRRELGEMEVTWKNGPLIVALVVAGSLALQALLSLIER